METSDQKGSATIMSGRTVQVFFYPGPCPIVLVLATQLLPSQNAHTKPHPQNVSKF